MPYRSAEQIQIPSCSLPTLLFKSPTHPLEASKPCFLDANRPDSQSITPADCRLWCQRLALGLQQHHKARAGAAQSASGRHARFQPGDRVLLFSENSLYYPVVFIGVAMAGGVFTGASPSSVERELVYQLKDSGAKYLLTSVQGMEVALKAAAKVGIDGDNIFIFNDDMPRSSSPRSRPSGSSNTPQHWSKLLAEAEDARLFQWPTLDSAALANTTLVLNYSSGTTGVPKGVEISHANYVTVVTQVQHINSQFQPPPGMLARIRYLNCLPMYHCMSQMINIGVAVFFGIPVYIMPTFNLPRMLSCIQLQKITNLLLTPPLVVTMIKSPSVKNANLSSVMSASCGGAPLSATTMHAFDRLWPPGKMTVVQVWGMTELTASVLTADPKFRESSTSVGRLLPNCEAKIVDPTSHQEVRGHGPNARGELIVRGPNIMKGYWRNPAATREMVGADGWLRTGDIAYVDEHERFYIVDRRKELIKATGGQVAPAEIESVLLEHPAVADVAVVGVVARSRDQGRVRPGDEEEFPKAYVVLQPSEVKSQRIKEKDLLQFVEKNVMPHKRLTGGLVFVKAIPRAASGKILRGHVKEWAASGDRAIPREQTREQTSRTRALPLR